MAWDSSSGHIFILPRKSACGRGTVYIEHIEYIEYIHVEVLKQGGSEKSRRGPALGNESPAPPPPATAFDENTMLSDFVWRSVATHPVGDSY